VSATLGIEEEDNHEEDDCDEYDDDGSEKQPIKRRRSYAQVLRAVQQRIKCEESKAFTALKTKWLIDYGEKFNGLF
jgi:hypothetical protein